MDKVERLGDLLAYLLHVRPPRTLREIVADVGGYPEEWTSARVQFARDRDLLVAEGADVVTTGSGDESRYYVDPAQYFLPDLGLSADEALALNLAASQVRVEGHDPDEALLSLGGFGVEGAATVALPFDDRLPVVFGAVRRRATVSFRYGDVDRVVEPYGMLCRDGNWYVAAFDRTRGGRRSFRIDRIEGAIAVGAAGAYEVPADFRLEDALPDEPYALAPDEPIDVEVWVDRVMAPRVHERDVVSRDDDDGSVVVRLRVSSVPGFRSWLLGLRDHARVLSPPAVVDAIVEWLEAI